MNGARTCLQMFFVVIPDAAQRRSDCVCRSANANTEGDPQDERHGWRESTQ
jgi:hypothetical protein